MKLAGWCMMAGLLGLVQPCRGEVVTQVRGPAALEIRWDGQVLGLADLITVTLTVEGAAPLATPRAPLDLGDDAKWILVERSRDSRESLSATRERWRLTYRFAPREPGKLAFHFPPVKYRVEPGGEKTASWDPVVFDVPTPATGELRDITSVEPPPPIVPRDWVVWIWSSAAGLALLLVGLAYGLHCFFRRAAALSPAHHSLEAWRRLDAKKLPENGRGERFITLLTLLVRRYLDQQFALRARRQTTTEFLQKLSTQTDLSQDEKRFLIDFLTRSDAVKFAGSEISADECEKWGEQTRLFLQRRLAL